MRFDPFVTFEAVTNCSKLVKILLRIKKEGSNKVLKEEGVSLVTQGRDLGLNYAAEKFGEFLGGLAYKVSHRKKKKKS